MVRKMDKKYTKQEIEKLVEKMKNVQIGETTKLGKTEINATKIYEEEISYDKKKTKKVNGKLYIFKEKTSQQNDTLSVAKGVSKSGETENEFRHNESTTNTINTGAPESVSKIIYGVSQALKNETPFHKPEMDKNNFAVVGIDTEFQAYSFLSASNREQEKTFLICTQLSFVLSNGERYHVFVLNYSLGDITITTYLNHILRYFYENNILFTSYETLKTKSKGLKHQNVLPCNLYFVFHNARCDMSLFRDLISKKNLRKYIEIGSSLITSKPINLKCCYARRVGRLGYNFSVNINIRDNMLYLTDSKSLDSYSDQTAYGKITDNNFDKSDMISHFLTDTDDFVRYALSDSATTVDFPIKLFDRLDPPLTIGSEANHEFVNMFCKDFKIKTKEEYYLKYSGLKLDYDRQVRKKEYRPLNSKLEEINNLFSKCYYGGINQCYTRGFEEDFSIDYDLNNAYPTFMYGMPMIDYKEEHSKFEIVINCSIDYAKKRTKRFVNLNCAIVDYDLKKAGFDGIKYIGLFPQKSQGSLFFTMSDNDVCISGPALYMGLKLKVITKIHKFVYVPTIPNEYPFKNYCQYWIDERKKYKKGTPGNTRCKLMANSLYGKTGQSVTDAKGTKYIDGEKFKIAIPQSHATNPIYASTITDLCRVVLIMSMSNVIEQGYQVFSVTTDGFISTYPNELINNILNTNCLTRDIHNFMVNTRKAITHNESGDYFEPKHINTNGFFNLATRTNIGVDDSGVLARGGSDFKKDRSIILDIIKNNFVLDEIQKRAPLLIEIVKGKKVYMLSDTPKKSRFDYDYKRKPNLETLKLQDISDVIVVSNGVEYRFDKGTTIPYFNTMLYENKKEFEDYKASAMQYANLNDTIVSSDINRIKQFVNSKSGRLKVLDKNIVLKSIFILLEDKYKTDKDYSNIKNFNSNDMSLMVQMIFDGVTMTKGNYRLNLCRYKKEKTRFDYISDDLCVDCIEKIIEYVQK